MRGGLKVREVVCFGVVRDLGDLGLVDLDLLMGMDMGRRV